MVTRFDIGITPNLEEISLPRFIEEVNEWFESTETFNLSELSLQLKRLSLNKSFLANQISTDLGRFVDGVLDDSDQSPVKLLYQNSHFLLRAVYWERNQIINSEQFFAHNHNFDFISVGYIGSGYETDIFEIADKTPNYKKGSHLELKERGRYRLSPGRVFHYKHDEVIHIQHPPSEFSISLNLIRKDEALNNSFPIFSINTKTGILQDEMSPNIDEFLSLAKECLEHG